MLIVLNRASRRGSPAWIARHSRKSGSASCHFACLSRSSREAGSPARTRLSGLSGLPEAGKRLAQRGSASAQRPSDS